MSAQPSDAVKGVVVWIVILAVGAVLLFLSSNEEPGPRRYYRDDYSDSGRTYDGPECWESLAPTC